MCTILLRVDLLVIKVFFIIDYYEENKLALSYLGKNFVLKGLDSFKHFLCINLPSYNDTQVFWSIELLMIVANLKKNLHL